MNELWDIEVNNCKVAKVLKSMKSNKAAGIDELESTFLIKIAEALINPLTLLFKRSLECGEVLEAWRRANVSAIFEKGSRKDPGN